MKSGKFIFHAVIVLASLFVKPTEPRNIKADEIKTPVIIGKYNMAFYVRTRNVPVKRAKAVGIFTFLGQNCTENKLRTFHGLRNATRT